MTSYQLPAYLFRGVFIELVHLREVGGLELDRIQPERDTIGSNSQGSGLEQSGSRLLHLPGSIEMDPLPLHSLDDVSGMTWGTASNPGAGFVDIPSTSSHNSNSTSGITF
jgi:hypothetical protein